MGYQYHMRLTITSQLIPYVVKQASLMEWADRTKSAGLMKSLAHLFGRGGRQLSRLQNRLEPHWLKKVQRVPSASIDDVIDRVTPFKKDIFYPGSYGYNYRMSSRGGAAPGMEQILQRLQDSLRGGTDVLERLPSIARTFADDVRGGGIWQNTTQAGRDLYKRYGLSLDEAGLNALTAEASMAPRLYKALQNSRQKALQAIHATQGSRVAKLQELQRKWDAGVMKRIFALGGGAGGIAGGIAGGRALLQGGSLTTAD